MCAAAPEGPAEVSLTRNPGYETNELVLRWKNPSAPSNDPAVLFKAQFGSGLVTSIHNGEKIFTGLTPATAYTITVWAEIGDDVKSTKQRLSQYTGMITW